MSLRGLLLTLALFAAASMVVAVPAFAKSVTVTWKEIPGAAAYELRLEKNGKTLEVKKTDLTHWEGELPFGLFAYQIRGIDKIDRPGEWSRLKPLVVMPAPPELIAPGNGEKVVMYDPKIKVMLKWKAVTGVERYFVEVRQGKKRVFAAETDRLETELGGASSGDYIWQVRPMVASGRNAPAELRGKKWQGNSANTMEFTLDYRKLDAPKLIYPVGPVVLSKTGSLKFKWKGVEGAEVYEVRLTPAPNGRSPAAAPRIFQSKDNLFVVENLQPGTWQWQVRALASVDPVKKTADAAGAESRADFQAIPENEHIDGAGYAAFSTMLAPYQYEANSPQFGGRAAVSSTALTARLSGEHWFWTKVALSLGLERTMFSVYGTGVSRSSLELMAKTQIALSSGRNGWYIMPKAGVESREYLRLIPNSTGGSLRVNESYGAKGVSVGFDLRKQFSERLSLGVKFAYWVPLALSGNQEGSRIGTNSSYRNYGLGIQGLYWLNKVWGLGAGVFLENRSIGYYPPNSSSSEQITMDAKYFFGSLIYSWGR